VEAATRELAATLQRTPTESEVAEKLGIDMERWRQMMVDLRSVGLISASSRAAEHDDLPAPDFPSKPETQPDNMCSHEQMKSVLGVAMKTLPERYQKVVVLYYTNEMTTNPRSRKCRWPCKRTASNPSTLSEPQALAPGPRLSV
jgi:RNA polymerase sigma factor for flagellar operon FliA